MQTIQILSWNQAKDLALDIRIEVFVNEQGVPQALELDEFDVVAWHALGWHGNQAIGTGRLLADGKIGRLAVLKDHRGKGMGKSLLGALIEFGQHQGIERFYLHAQTAAIGFYEALGFKTNGPVFNEAGIEHIKMIKSN